MKIIATLTAVLMLAGCSFAQPVVERVQKAVDVYCLESEAERQLIRATVNPTPNGNTVTVQCSD